MTESVPGVVDWRSGLQQEWVLLQAQHEQAERMAYGIKAGAVLSSVIGLVVAGDFFLLGLLLVLWLQEAILRTSQARVGARLLRIETLLRAGQGSAQSAFQLHTEWLANRGTTRALLAEYLMHARRPTVAYPYAVLLLILLLAWFAGGAA